MIRLDNYVFPRLDHEKDWHLDLLKVLLNAKQTYDVFVGTDDLKPLAQARYRWYWELVDKGWVFASSEAPGTWTFEITEKGRQVFIQAVAADLNVKIDFFRERIKLYEQIRDSLVTAKTP